MNWSTFLNKYSFLIVGMDTSEIVTCLEISQFYLVKTSWYNYLC